MVLKVNGTKLDVTLEDEKTVGDVLKAFENEAARNDATTVSIKLNGKDIDAGHFDEAAGEELKEDTELDLTVISKGDLKEAFAENASNFKALSEKLKEVSVFMQSSREKEAGTVIKLLADEIDAFCHTATLSALFPDVYESLKIEGQDAGTFFNELSPLLSDLKSALETKDIVTVGDLSEYEISPRLEKLSQAITAVVSGGKLQ